MIRIRSSELTVRDGRHKSPSCFALREDGVRVRARKYRLCVPWRKQIAWGFYSFLFCLALLAFGGCPRWRRDQRQPRES